MAERPIIFSAGMVRALLAGSKTQTRRVMKPQPPVTDRDRFFGATFGLDRDLADGVRCVSMNDWDHQPKHPTRWRLLGSVGVARDAGFPDTYDVRFAVGDRLWVREAASWPKAWDEGRVTLGHVFYPASADAPGKSPWLREPEDHHGRVKSSIHMPRTLSRLTLTVTDVRVQRVQEISRGDALEEGCPFPNMADGPDPRDWFRGVWNSIHGPGAWDANPWVVALTFTVARQNIDAVPDA